MSHRILGLLVAGLFSVSASAQTAAPAKADAPAANPAAKAAGKGTSAPATSALVDKAVNAIGRDALADARTAVIRARTKHWEPDQSVQAGGEMRFAGDSTLVVSRDLISGAARNEWKKSLQYPSVREQSFSEVFSNGVGAVVGIDSNSRTKQNREANPPGHTMSAARASVTARELARTSPILLWDMAQNPKRVKSAGMQKAGGKSLPAVSYDAGIATFTVLFDPASGLPERIRTRDYDALQGDSDYDLVLADWRDAGGMRFPFKQSYQLNGRTVYDISVDAVEVNASLSLSLFSIPEALRPKQAPKLSMAGLSPQWIIRRQFIGNLLDSDAMFFDGSAVNGLTATDLAPGVVHVTGGTHNTMLVEMDKFVVVFDAPIGERMSKATMELAAKRFAGKPVKYVVLTHHHMDHTSGIRTFAAAGATIVVGKGNGAFFRKAITSSDKLGADSPKKAVKPSIIEVESRWIITDGKRDVGAYVAENPHATALLIGYVPDAAVGFVTDIWSPGAGPLPAVANPPLQAVINTVRRFGLEPQRFAGGHGGVASYADLAKISAQ